MLIRYHRACASETSEIECWALPQLSVGTRTMVTTRRRATHAVMSEHFGGTSRLIATHMMLHMRLRGPRCRNQPITGQCVGVCARLLRLPHAQRISHTCMSIRAKLGGLSMNGVSIAQGHCNCLWRVQQRHTAANVLRIDPPRPLQSVTWNGPFDTPRIRSGGATFPGAQL